MWTISELSLNTIQMENEIKYIIYRNAVNILGSQLGCKKSDNSNNAIQESFIHLYGAVHKLPRPFWRAYS